MLLRREPTSTRLVTRVWVGYLQLLVMRVQAPLQMQACRQLPLQAQPGEREAQALVLVLVLVRLPQVRRAQPGEAVKRVMRARLRKAAAVRAVVGRAEKSI